MKKPAPIVTWALGLSLVAPFLIGLGAIGAHTNAIPFDTAFDLIATKIAGAVALISTIVAVVALFVAFSNFQKLGLTALAALLISGATLAGEARFFLQAGSAVPVHDVSTNWADPVEFSDHLMYLREGAENPVEDDPHVPASAGAPYGGMRVADVNAKTCPGAKAVPHGVDADKAVKALQANGFQVAGSQVFLVEGTKTGTWFGATDDVAVRIRPERTDVRASRRAGLSDYGANCENVTRIVQALSR
jgi:fatty-acyl-CoA synthase